MACKVRVIAFLLFAFLTLPLHATVAIIQLWPDFVAVATESREISDDGSVNDQSCKLYQLDEHTIFVIEGVSTLRLGKTKLLDTAATVFELRSQTLPVIAKTWGDKVATSLQRFVPKGKMKSIPLKAGTEANQAATLHIIRAEQNKFVGFTVQIAWDGKHYQPQVQAVQSATANSGRYIVSERYLPLFKELIFSSTPRAIAVNQSIRSGSLPSSDELIAPTRLTSYIAALISWSGRKENGGPIDVMKLSRTGRVTWTSRKRSCFAEERGLGSKKLSLNRITATYASDPSKTATVTVNITGGGGPSFVQAQGCGAAATSCNVSITATTGNALFVAVGSGGGSGTTVFTISDGTNTYTETGNGGVIHPAGDITTTMDTYYAKNITGGSLTVNCSTTDAFSFCIVAEVSGVSTTSPNDFLDAKNGSGSSPITSNAWSTASANEIVFGAAIASSGTTWSAGSGYTIPMNGQQGTVLGIQYQIFSMSQSMVTDSMTGSTGGNPAALLTSGLK